MNLTVAKLAREVTVLLVAALPLVELRGAIPIGVSLGIKPLPATVLGIVGSLLPVPFLLAFLKSLVLFCRHRGLFKRPLDYFVNRTMRKSDAIRKYSALGLLIFVAIPLPTTGVWSGSLAAVIFNIPYRTALLAIAVGNILAGMIMMLLSHTILGAY